MFVGASGDRRREAETLVALDDVSFAVPHGGGGPGAGPVGVRAGLEEYLPAPVFLKGEMARPASTLGSAAASSRRHRS